MSYSFHSGPNGPGGQGAPPTRPPREEHRFSGMPNSPPSQLPNQASTQYTQQQPAGGSFGSYTNNISSNSNFRAPGPGGPSVSFQVPERPVPQRNSASSDSHIKKDSRRESKQHYAEMPTLDRSSSAIAATNTLLSDMEGGFSSNNANFRRKKSLVRPDRERMDPSHRQWYYRNHAANMDAVDASGRAAGFSYMPSTTGHLPQHGAAPFGSEYATMQGPGGGLSGLGMGSGRMNPHASNMPPGGLGRSAPANPGGLRRGKSILGRDEDQVESGINVLKRGVSLRRRASQQHRKEVPRELDDQVHHSKIAPGPVGPWMMYCYVLTICCPGPCLGIFGIKTPDQQRAFREKMGLISIVLTCMAFVGFITFGFTKAVCDTGITRYHAGDVDGGSTSFYGYTYDFNSFFHPQVGPFGANTPFNHSNPAYSDPWLTGGKDASYLFPVTGGKCANFLKTSGTNDQPTAYFPCQVYNQDGTQYKSNSSWCHDGAVSTKFLLPTNPMRKGQLSYNWNDITDPTRNLAVWKGSVLDLSRIKNLNVNVSRPDIFNTLASRNETFAGKDVSTLVLRSKQDEAFDCLEQLVRVGFVDSETIGCVASKVELYVSLVFIIGVVAIKFFMAVIFGWFISWRLGNYRNETYEERMKRAAEIEDWTEDIYRPAPAAYRPNAKKSRTFLPTTSRFSTAHGLSAMAGAGHQKNRSGMSEKVRSPASRPNRIGGLGSPLGSPPSSPSLQGVRSSSSLVGGNQRDAYGSRRSSFSVDPGSPNVQSGAMGACPFPLYNVVPQPPADYQPFNFTLAHSICMVTAYSESFEGLRTTLDSLATTDYPNSHKLLLVVADGIVKGADSDLSTPDICLSMMKDFIVDPQEVEGNSYVAVADNERRHNMAKVYAGFYDYDDETVEKSKQQRVPMVLVAKCGSPLEARSAKPGNRGKRDSQVLLMAFMQKVMFDERMTLFEYEFFNAIWRVTGVSPDHYEIVLMVDADTKVFPDSLSRMVACMVEDPEIMGLCGETKIANKAETWVTMIQVFEYYISHHQTKAFEACFGGVTCLPGCFSAYRIKAPKGPHGYWVPILANPDIVEHYSENVVDTLHKKNLLLLGEDRYLTTLMLKTFPKRKMMFAPQAVCKTIVPDTFRVLLSQRRRWINSTVHNLAELLLVNDLCGTFCFSMRFVVFMELAGTLVLPAAIAFTLYVIISSISSGNAAQNAIPLALLGVILGLPGVLIIVTSRRISYVGWMMIYLISLPIWNFVFPSYAFWHMDDFSWGATRVIQEAKHSGEAEEDIKFDANMIIMKRWAEFERERRWRSGTHSRDSTYDVVHRSATPERSGSTRYSVVSSDTYHSNPSGVGGNGQHDGAARLLSNQQPESNEGRIATSGARARLDAVPLLELPAPLGPDGGARARSAAASAAASGSISVPRPRDTMGGMQSFQSFKTPLTTEGITSSSSSQTYGNGSDESRNHLSSKTPSPDPHDIASRFAPATRGGHLSPSPAPTASSHGTTPFSAIAHAPQPSFGNVASEQRYPNLHEAQFAQGFSAEPELMSTTESQSTHVGSNAPWTPHQQAQRGPQPQLPRLNMQSPSRGFSLVDDGPVASPTGVRQVTRGARRMSSVNSGQDNHGVNGRGRP